MHRAGAHLRALKGLRREAATGMRQPLDDDHALTSAQKLRGGEQAAQSGPNDDDIELTLAHVASSHSVAATEWHVRPPGAGAGQSVPPNTCPRAAHPCATTSRMARRTAAHHPH